MIEKRPWPAGEISPWADEKDRPGVLEIARAYPDRAISTAGGAAILAVIGTGIIAWAINVAAHAVVGTFPFSTAGRAVMLWPVVTAVFWWYMMEGVIRGYWRPGSD
jgi:hypothetical protein